MDKYYKEQLRMLREGASAFGRQYPAIAPMLLAQGGDPDVERILEGTAYLCSRIHERLDLTAPDLIQSLLHLIFPQAILPVPSTTLLRFRLTPGFGEALRVPHRSQVASNPVDGIPCIYTTMHDLDVLPLEPERTETAAFAGSGARVSVTFRSSVPVASFLKGPLVLHLAGGTAAPERLLALLTACEGVEVTTGAGMGSGSFRLPAGSVRYHPLPLDDIRLPAGRRNSRSYMEIIRYFHFPEKLLFLEVHGLDRLPFAEDTKAFTLSFLLRQGTTPLPDFPEDCIVPNVVPAVNLFRVAADPLVIDHTQDEYLVRPQDGKRRFLEILGVDHMSAMLAGGRQVPCLLYDAWDRDTRGLLHSIRFRASNTPGVTEQLLTPLYRFGGAGADLSDPGIGVPDRYTLSMDLLCCNHTLPSSLRAGDICRPTDSSPSQATFTNIVAPTPMFPRPTAERLHWRLLSHLNANLLSLASPEALRELLTLYLPDNGDQHELSTANLRRIAAIRAFSSEHEEMLYRGRLLRGRRLDLTLDPAGFTSTGEMYLFVNALDRFFTEFTSINNYSRLCLTVAGSGARQEWPPRLGEKQLI